MKYDLIVIGGGPAGLLGAYAAASRGLKTILLEKNETLGKKLSLTGNGRCNLTNLGDVEDHKNNIVTNKNFLNSALYTFDSYQLISLIETHGLKTKVEPGNRVFPVTEQSSDVIKVLESLIKKHSVEIMFNASVKKLLFQNGNIKGILLNSNYRINGDKVLLATGGMSYKQTGSSGDGYILARQAGHNIIPPRPALIPLKTKEQWPKQLQGVTLKDVEVRLILREQEIKQAGDVLFTHFGLSGPAILKGSSYIKEKDAFPLAIKIDLIPELTEEQLSRDLQEKLNKNPGKNIKNVLYSFITKSIVPLILNFNELPATRQVDQVTKTERKNLARTIKNLTLTATDTLPLNQAIVTGGGIDTKEIHPSTLESKIIRGLYFAGEIIDIDALTGGYNLQIAFSTGYLSGISAAGH